MINHLRAASSPNEEPLAAYLIISRGPGGDCMGNRLDFESAIKKIMDKYGNKRRPGFEAQAVAALYI